MAFRRFRSFLTPQPAPLCCPSGTWLPVTLSRRFARILKSAAIQSVWQLSAATPLHGVVELMNHFSTSVFASQPSPPAFQSIHASTLPSALA